MSIGSDFTGGVNANQSILQSHQFQQAQSQQMAQFQQQKQMQMAQLQQAAQQHQLQAQQFQAEQQQVQVENQFKAQKTLQGYETPAAYQAGVIGMLQNKMISPAQAQSYIAAMPDFQAKTNLDLLEHNMTTTPPTGDTQQADLPPAPFGLPSPSSLMMNRPPSPVGQVGGQNVYRQPNPLQDSEIAKNNAIANKNNASGGTGGIGQPAGNDTKNALWAKHVLALAKQNPQSVDPQTLEVAKQVDESSNLTPESTDLYADMALQTGTLPGGFGMSKVRTAVMNKVGETAKTLGIGAGDIIGAGAEYSANKGALNQLTKQKTMVDAFSEFTDKQLGSLDTTLQNLQKKVALYDSSLLNKPVISWEKNVQGSPEVQAYLQQLASTRTEVARLVSGLANSGSGLTVQSMKDWEDVIAPTSSPAQVGSFIKQARIDKFNRQSAFDQAQQNMVDKFKKGFDPKRLQNFVNSSSQTQTPDSTEQVTQGAATE